MLKLMIADDERIIRETISSLINWKAYDIQLVGLCKNGLEAYDTILDESPDIVLTDIRMPGMNGLELIQKISETDLDTKFIILSGYSEFEYAKQAMKYGVKHYLLKPCNEQQIIESIQDLAKDCQNSQLIRYSLKRQFLTADNMCHNVLFSIINDTIYQKQPYDETIRKYEPYMDFHFTAYRLFYIYFLEQNCLEKLLQFLDVYCNKHFPSVTIHGIYTRNTLILFFKDFCHEYQNFMKFLSSLPLTGQNVTLELEELSFPSLNDLLLVIMSKVKRYSMIYYINHTHVLSSFNYNFIMAESEHLYHSILQGNNQAQEALLELLANIDDLRFLKQLTSSLLLKITANDASLSTIQLAEFLITMEQESDLLTLQSSISSELKQLFSKKASKSSVSTMTQQIFDYVETHIQNPNLTLKFISEQYLFMNTDYVSKKFQKDTGIRFSTYLTEVRIQKAKEYLSENDPGKIQTVAERVGCGNNPQYFSQLFKKNTGMSPSTYASKLHS